MASSRSELVTPPLVNPHIHLDEAWLGDAMRPNQVADGGLMPVCGLLAARERYQHLLTVAIARGGAAMARTTITSELVLEDWRS